MHRLWHFIGPLLDAAQARSVLEIGTGDGALSRLLLTRAAPHGGTVYSIDTTEATEVQLLRKQAGPSFIFHHGSSLDVLPSLTDIDAILIDGDHNWYTVLGELRAIAALAQRQGCFPLVLLHDTAWPYGRRDMYYAPSSIPPPFRHPHGRRGLHPAEEGVTDDGGFNSGMDNALQEGGPRNGVRTAVEDWLAETPDPPRFLALHGFHGLGILAPAPLLQRVHALAALLHDLTPSTPVAAHLHTLEQKRLLVVIQCEDERARLTQSLRESEDERARLTQSLRESEDERARLTQSLRENAENLHHVLHTRSWRWTLPFRMSEKLLRQWLQQKKEGPRCTQEKVYGTPRVLPPVDIIIPVFNAAHVAISCIESVLTCTHGTYFRLIIIDDCSTDAALHAYYRHLTERNDPRVLILRNPANIGFVQSANRGMCFGEDHDIVLLNSDTLVSPGWLEGLRAVARSKTDAASITPLSNCASCFSILSDTESTAALTRMGAARVGTLIHEHSLRLAPAIPTAVGFCMYMRRSAIQAVGTFDEEFGIGYGEENDWCMRASAARFRHYLDDATFVYHRGHVSMLLAGHIHPSDDHPAQSQALLARKHPSYPERIRAFLSTDTAIPRIRSHAHDVLWHAHHNRQFHIAFLVHAPVDGTSIGGTEFHVCDLTSGLAAHAECTVIFPQHDALIAEHHAAHGCRRYTFPLSPDWQRESSLTRAFTTVMRAFGIELLHVHHVLGTSFHLLRVAKRQGAVVVYTVHDFHALGHSPPCASGTGTILAIPGEKALAENIVRRGKQRRIVSALRNIDCIVFPSAFAQRVFHEHCSRFGAMQCIIEHGTDVPRIRGSVPRLCRRICFLGPTHTRHKGGCFAVAVAMELAHCDMDVFFAGTESSHFSPILTTHPRVHFMGIYARNNLPRLLIQHNIGLVCLLSLSHETFCYALSETWCAGLPAYVTPVGALAERVTATGAGRIAPCLEPHRVAEDILAFLQSTAYAQACHAAQTLMLKTNAEMCAEYLTLYRTLLMQKASTALPVLPLPGILRRNKRPCHKTCGVSPHREERVPRISP